MKIFLDKFFFGNGKNLIIDDGFFMWEDESDGFYDLKLEPFKLSSLDMYLGMFGFKNFQPFSESQVKIVKDLKIRNPVWKFFLKKEDFNKSKEYTKEKLNQINKEVFSKKYSSFFVEGNFILKKLSNIHVDLKLLKKLKASEQNPTLKSIISSFIPKNSNKCDVIVYNRMKTTTGRLVVDTGPQILLLPKVMKKSLVSRYGENGSVLWVDFVSLEPRFTKLLTADNTKVDLYQDILDSSNLGCAREEIKLAVLSSLFGAGINKLSEIVGKNAFAVRDLIKEYFSLDQVMSLVGDYKSGQIVNYFGRPIKLKKSSSNVALNNYIQSSCVDISLLGFSRIVKDNKFPNSAFPIAIVHDALAIDVKNSELSALEEIINKGIFIEGLGKFYLGCETYDE